MKCEQLSATVPDSAKIVTDQSFDQWSSAGCLTNQNSDVASTPNRILIDPLL